MKSPEQRGHYGALCLYQIIDPCKIRMKSRLVISLSNTSCSVDDCAKSEIAYDSYEAKVLLGEVQRGAHVRERIMSSACAAASIVWVPEAYYAVGA